MMEAQNASLPMGNGAQVVQQGSHAAESAQLLHCILVEHVYAVLTMK